MCLIKIEGEVHCLGAGLVAACRAGCRLPGGHKGRRYERRTSCRPFNSFDARHEVMKHCWLAC